MYVMLILKCLQRCAGLMHNTDVIIQHPGLALDREFSKVKVGFPLFIVDQRVHTEAYFGMLVLNFCVLYFPQLVKGAPESLLRSLHIQKDPIAYNYIKVGGHTKVLHFILLNQMHISQLNEAVFNRIVVCFETPGQYIVIHIITGLNYPLSTMFICAIFITRWLSLSWLSRDECVSRITEGSSAVST